ncbi:S-adenosyl-L-methionine-dependent methyltransferase [Parathielavia hyrcaniae]|uniref:S-adenosyl-L-methionine-dependent methyltransferase n=1 Tax=Parathielavia hyrcaniae TaxID=113614 RepID=A0AAN6Q0E6_9PEZI|nr:S-adenosyl-L-methionine-dependent methyltransferase [Parathielavia hyrcaniae]
MTSNTANSSTSDVPVVPFIPGRLISHFQSKPQEHHGIGWTELWDSGQSDLWDRGKPSPALIDLIESKPDEIPRPNASSRRPRALVPGCGKGYDVTMLALHGCDVYGLEVSATGVETARAYAAAQLAAPSAYNFSDAAAQDQYSGSGPGQATFIVGDFFARDWEVQCRSDDGAFTGFDLIYDYTFLCAMLPERRQDWARRMRELIAPSGVLVCLEFPTYKGLEHPGPPWGLREGIYWDLLAAGGKGMFDDEESVRAATQATSGGAFTRLRYIKPPRSYEVANGTDMLSIWAPRGS